MKRIDIEESLLGELANNNERVINALIQLKVGAALFTDNRCQLYQELIRMFQENLVVDDFEISDYLLRSGRSADLDYVNQCRQKKIRPAQIIQHIRILQECHTIREVKRLISTTQDELDQQEIDVDGLLARFKEATTHLGVFTELEKDRTEIVKEIRADYYRALTSGSIGISSRWAPIQELLMGYQEGTSIIVAGRPKEGKTTFICNEHRRWGIMDNPIPTGIISLEDKSKALIEKMAGEYAQVDLKKFKKGLATEEEIDRFVQIAEQITRAPIYFDDEAYTIEQICNSIANMVIRHKVKIVTLDYIQLLPRINVRETRAQELAQYSARLVQLAKSLKITMIINAQLNRLAVREKPHVSHLRDSGALEADAHAVLLIYRKPSFKNEYSDTVPTTVDIAVNRNGATGEVPMIFLKSLQRLDADTEY